MRVMRMSDRHKVVRELEHMAGIINQYTDMLSVDCDSWVILDALELLKEQEARELTIDEWKEWKANPKRDPICKLWENDTSPMWVLNPNDVHEPALLMGKLKLFTGKPTLNQCKEVKWDE